MKKIRITVKKIARYDDLIARYENPIEHACEMKTGDGSLSLMRDRCSFVL